MTLIEAIETGKRFRRLSWGNSSWMTQQGDHLQNEVDEVVKIRVTDAIATDWEVDEPSTPITWRKFMEAASKVTMKIRNVNSAKPLYEEVSLLKYFEPSEWSEATDNKIEELAKVLGLEKP